MSKKLPYNYTVWLNQLDILAGMLVDQDLYTLCTSVDLSENFERIPRLLYKLLRKEQMSFAKLKSQAEGKLKHSQLMLADLASLQKDIMYLRENTANIESVKRMLIGYIIDCGI